MRKSSMNLFLILIFVFSLITTIDKEIAMSDQNGSKHSSADDIHLEHHLEKIVIIRDDDVYKVDPGLEWLSKFVIDNDLKITYAVIPAEISSDQEVISYLNNLDKNNFELATHGYEHKDFKGLSYTVQYSLINKATNLMKQYFKSRPYTFIPPYENADINTAKVCRAIGYHSISCDTIEEPYVTNFVRDFSWEDYSIPNEPDYEVPHSSFVDFKSNFDEFYNNSSENYYVIVMHHSTWYDESDVVDETLAKTFENAIDYMKSKNVEFMTMEQAYEWHINKDYGQPLSAAL